MRILPIVERELRASARHSFTYALRVMGVLALFVVLGLFSLGGSIGPEIGGRLFASLHTTLFVAVWLLVPLLTADCISRERREGTLPLLFLTNLAPRDIVYAKGLAHGLRAFTLWLAVLPVLAVPLAAGGVGRAEVVISALVNLSSICLATSAGLAASSMARVWSRALAMAGCLAVFLLIWFILALPLVVPLSGVGRIWPWRMANSGPELGLAIALNSNDLWQQFLGVSRTGPWPVLRSFVAVTLVSLLVLGAWISFAAWRVKRFWREEPASVRVQWIKDKLFTPMVLQSFLRRWLRWQLHQNPIGWLEQRSWSGRLVVWSWFAVVICIYSSLFANLSLYQRGFHAVQGFLASLLAGSIALSAAGSFRRERETGVLELLLVSPVGEWQIIAGRVRGLWIQFLPAMVLLVSVWLYAATFLSTDSELLSVLVYGMTFATLPVIGLYYSLAKANFIVSLLWTLLVGVAVPVALGRIAALWFGPGYGPPSTAPDLPTMLLPGCFQILFAGLFAWRLHHQLRYRKFALENRAGQ